MSNSIKELRKQLRSVVADLLPEFVKDALFAKLQEENRLRLDSIERSIRETLNQIDARSRDMQSFAIREMTRRAAEAPKAQE